MIWLTGEREGGREGDREMETERWRRRDGDGERQRDGEGDGEGDGMNRRNRSEETKRSNDHTGNLFTDSCDIELFDCTKSCYIQWIEFDLSVTDELISLLLKIYH